MRIGENFMDSQPSTYEEKLSRLQKQIQSSLKDSWKKYSFNNNLDVILTILYITLGTAITVLSFSGQATIAGVIGAILTALLSLQKVFNLSEKANFYRGLHMQTKELRDKLTYKVSTEEDLQAIVDSFIAMRNDRILKNPRRRSLDE
jgi:hypothetical protein